METIRRILAPVDLTSGFDEALSCALTLGAVFRARVQVCHVIETDALSDELRDRRQQDVTASVAASARPRGRLPEWEPMILTGDTVSAITRTAAAQHTDLIVMNARHRTYASTLLGSTTEAVCHQAPCPVLITHPQEPDEDIAAPEEAGFHRILMAHDFSLDSETALLFALALAREFGATLNLLHVMPAATGSAGAIAERDLLAAQNRLTEALPENVHEQIEIRQFVKAGIPWREILTVAEEVEADLICLGIRGSGLPKGELAGSNADRILREATCPVLIARPLKPASFVLAESRVETHETIGEI